MRVFQVRYHERHFGGAFVLVSRPTSRRLCHQPCLAVQLLRPRALCAGAGVFVCNACVLLVRVRLAHVRLVESKRRVRRASAPENIVRARVRHQKISSARVRHQKVLFGRACAPEHIFKLGRWNRALFQAEVVCVNLWRNRRRAVPCLRTRQMSANPPDHVQTSNVECIGA